MRTEVKYDSRGEEALDRGGGFCLVLFELLLGELGRCDYSFFDQL